MNTPSTPHPSGHLSSGSQCSAWLLVGWLLFFGDVELLRPQGAASSTPAAPAARIRVAVLPFGNATGDARLDDWSTALSSFVRRCLRTADSTEVLSWAALQPVLRRAGVEKFENLPVEVLHRVALELDADVVVSGTFTKQGDERQIEGTVARVDGVSGAGSWQVAFRRWSGLPGMVALRLTERLQRGVPAQETQRWNELFGTSETALQLLAHAVALGFRDAPQAEQEQTLRQVLKEDPRCGLAYDGLRGVMIKEQRMKELQELVEEHLRQMPDSCEPHVSFACLKMMAEDAESAKRGLNEAVRLHPGCPTAAKVFFSLYTAEGDMKPAEIVLERMHQARPQEMELGILLACSMAENGKREGVRDLLQGLVRLPEEDDTLDVALLAASLAGGRLDLAGLELARLGPKASRNEWVRETVSSLRFDLSPAGAAPSNAPIVRPRSLTQNELQRELQQRLTPQELGMVENPAELSPESLNEARRLTMGLENPVAKVLAIFAEVACARRTAASGQSATARPEPKLSCHQHASRFVNLARSGGLDAWMVHIDRDALGYPGYHDCAVVFLQGQGVLVDPTWKAVGLRHQAIQVLDDLQAISHRAMQIPVGEKNAQRFRMGLKLNPDDRWTQLQFVRAMVRVGDQASAIQVLSKVQQSGVETWDSLEVAAEIDMARKLWQPALAKLENALKLSPSNALVHAQLVDVHMELNHPDKAKEHLESALRFDRGEIPSELRNESPSQLAVLGALSQGKSGSQTALDELKRLAEGGDSVAQLGLAKSLFEQRPPRTEEGMHWLRRAAAQGDSQAQFFLAQNLLAIGGEEVASESVQWLTKSAEQGYAEAQYRLGLMLYDSRLVPRDNRSAGKWTLIAAEGGHVEAKRLFREMELFLSAAELADCRKGAETFRSLKK